jgi:DNA-binding NtrC family response regulator
MNPASPDSRKTILVVDGPALVRQLLADALAPADRYNLLTADSGARALQKSTEFKGEIHLLLTGLRMPGMSGIELAAAMSIDRPRLTVLIMSLFPDDAIVLNEQWHYLPKPFHTSQLRAFVARLMFPDETSDL